jgi:hypothetical protein
MVEDAAMDVDTGPVEGHSAAHFGQDKVVAEMAETGVG